MAELQENMVVADRFRLVRMIGRGGMGSVWQAMHLGLDTPCAVKFIEGELANVAEAHARFEREAKAAAQLRSPNVVQIFDHGVWQGTPYIAMELLEGEDLGKRLTAAGGRLQAADVNFVVQQVCRALSRAHQAGVVHRDLKPDNIFIVKDDDRDIVKILDFGVAKAATALDGSNTKTGAMLGTPYYMSPEQAQGIKSVDARSDLWSLAVIVFQCLTGRLPFESEALGDLLVKIIVSPVPTPSAYFAGVPPGFDGWWGRAADRNPENRYPTAKAFAESLALALGQSSSSLTQERGRLGRGSEHPGGGTAIMHDGPGAGIMANVPNTPQPGMAYPGTSTPNPMQTPPGAIAPAGQPAYGQPGYPPQQPAHGTTGNPVAATFSGIDPQGVPKKSAPVALFVGIGALVVVGAVVGGVAVFKGRAQASGGDLASASAASGASSAPVAKATDATEAADAGAPSASAGAAASAAPATTTSAAATSAATADTGAPASRPAAAIPAARPPTPVAGGFAVKPATPTAPGVKPAASAKKAYDPGF